MIYDIVCVILLINHFWFVNDFTEAGPGLVLLICGAKIFSEITIKIGKMICDHLAKWLVSKSK